MKSKQFRGIIFLLTAFAGLMCFSGCASMVVHGGSLVSKNDPYIKETLVTYKAEGIVPEGTTYHLVRTEKGFAVFEQANDGSGALFENHWEDADGDHFATWLYLPGGGKSRHGYEFVVPKDRMKIATKYVYPWGTYVVQEINGVERPVPANPVDPVATLVSTQSGLIHGLELRNAAKLGDLSRVESLLTTYPDIVSAKDVAGNTPLHFAAGQGRKEVAQLLIAKGTDVNIRDNKGNTPLCFAAGNGRKDVVELLIAKGADVNAKDKKGVTTLHYACVTGHKDVAELLIANGANVNAKASRAVTVLHFAAIKGYKDVAELLINKGADVNARDGDGLTPLKCAIKDDHKEVAELLRQHGGVE